MLEETRSLQRTHIPGNAKEANLYKCWRVNGTSANLLVYIDTADLWTSFSEYFRSDPLSLRLLQSHCSLALLHRHCPLQLSHTPR